MHLLAIIFTIAFAIVLRCQPVSTDGQWSQRWYRTLFLFCFPGLLLLTTAITVLYMGCHGRMLGVRVGSVGCSLAGGLILLAVGCLLRLAYQGDRFLRGLSRYPRQAIGDTTVRVVDLELPYSAQVGFWQSESIVSQGLLAVLDAEHLTAVMAHEQAHAEYRDTFWFFWLGWVRRFSFWLPNTHRLWQELVLLRELRADRRAIESADFLLLAESLLTVAKAPLETEIWCVGLNDPQIGDRLEERINSLLDPIESVEKSCWHHWSWLCLLLLPFLTIPLHT